jgi:hypothetical protein
MTELMDAGAVLKDNLSRVETRDGGELVSVRIHGSIECSTDLLVVVDKWLDVRRDGRGRHQVKGRRYVYQALVRTTGVTVLRYDNAHGNDRLHRHVQGQDEPIPISLDDLPTLTGFIEESLSIVAPPSATPEAS